METSLFVAAAPPLHGGRALRAVPLPLGRLGQADAAVVEPLDGTLRTQTASESGRTRETLQQNKHSRLCCHSRPSLHRKPETQEEEELPSAQEAAVIGCSGAGVTWLQMQ